MSGEVVVRFATEGAFVLVFLQVLLDAVRYPARARLDAALFFGAIVAITAVGWGVDAFGTEPGRWIASLSSSLLMALPYLLLRLTDDFAGVPRRVRIGAALGLAGSVAIVFAFDAGRLPAWGVLLLVGYFAVVQGYCGVRFTREARRAVGSARRRLQAAAAGTWGLLIAIVAAGVAATAPGADTGTAIILRGAGLACALAYLVAFAPPSMLRRAWNEPELRGVMLRTGLLARRNNPTDVARAIESAALTMTGAASALVLIADESGTLEAATRGPDEVVGAPLADRAFIEQRTLADFDVDPSRFSTAPGEGLRHRSAIVAPISTDDRQLGVLAIYAAHEPLFAHDVIDVVGLLAQQAAVLLENQALTAELVRARASDEVNRLKEDFLSLAAHDLRSPLTTLLGQAQLMERRWQRRPDAPVDPVAVRHMVHEAERMAAVVDGLLDVDRAKRGSLSSELVALDLTALVRDATESFAAPRHTIAISLGASLPVRGDRDRLLALLQNLLENAVKYSPSGGSVGVSVSEFEGEALLEVSDEGIGIAEDELPLIFERFWRSPSLDDGHFTGLGLGLYMCQRIVEEHGGRIWATSRYDAGSRLYVALPLLDRSGSE